MEISALFTLFLLFALVVCSAVLLANLLKRSKQVLELEKKLKAVSSEAATQKRSLESVNQANESDRERLQQAESEVDELRSDLNVVREELDSGKQIIAEKEKRVSELTVEVEASEPTRKRAREAEDKLLALQKETASLRTESSQAYKRVEAAESAARDKQIQYERVEATLEAKDKALIAKQQESADLAHELSGCRTEISELVIERDKLKSMEIALGEKLTSSEESFKECERAKQRLNDEFTQCRLDLGESQEQLKKLKQMFDEQASSGADSIEQLQKLRDQLLETEGKLGRKEAALKDLEVVFKDADRETPYEAHHHMDWTLNHFDPKSITFKFKNVGAKIHFVDVETSVPQLRHEFETGRELPRDEDFEARLKLAIKKAEQKNMEALPSEFDMTVYYALNVYPIQFKIRPHEGQRIERIK